MSVSPRFFITFRGDHESNTYASIRDVEVFAAKIDSVLQVSRPSFRGTYERLECYLFDGVEEIVKSFAGLSGHVGSHDCGRYLGWEMWSSIRVMVSWKVK